MDSLEVAAKVLKANVFSATGENISEKQAKHIAAATTGAWLEEQKALADKLSSTLQTYELKTWFEKISEWIGNRLSELKDTTS